MLNPDIIIFSIFLLINLGVGLFYSRGVTTIEQYAIGDRKFSTSALVSTIVASWLGAGFISCTLAETYRQGLYFLIPGIFYSLGLALIGSLFVNRMGEFLGKLSIAEAMGELFGNKVKLVTVVTGIILSIGALGMQFKVAAKILELVFGASGVYATLFSAGIIILYSTFGGIKAVTFTDIIQFFTFGAIIPVIASIIWCAMNDSSTIFNTINTNSSFSISAVLDLSNPKFYEMLGLCIVFLPNFSPITFQRLAMAKSTDQARRSFNIAGLVCFAIQSVVVCIAIFLLSEHPNLNPNELVTYIMNNYTYTGFKGVVAIGIMAMIMSTADSLINSMSVIFAHDFCKPLGFKWSDNELKVSKIFAVASGLIAIIFAFKFHTILNIIALFYGFYISVVTIPFIFAIFGFRSSEKSVLIGMFAGAITFYAWNSKLLSIDLNIDSCLPSLLANIVFLFGSHYLLQQPGGWVGIKDQKSLEQHRRMQQRDRQEFGDMIFNFSFKQFLQNNLPKNESIYHIVGFISAFLVVLNAISIKFTFASHLHQYNLPLIVTLSAIAWSISTLFIIYPVMRPVYKNMQVVPVCWTLGLFVAMVCVPTAFLILSNFSIPQFLIFGIYIIGLSFLVNWATSLLMIAIGTCLAAFVFQDYLVIDQGLQVQISFAFILFSTVLIALARPLQATYAIQEKRCNKLESEKVEMSDAIKNLSIVKQEFLNNLSHEIRTPLHHIGAGAEAIYKDWTMYNFEQIRDFAEVVYKGYKGATKYIDSLLDFSNLSANRINLNLNEKDFVNLVESGVAECKELCLQNSCLQIDLLININPLLITCDEEKIKKVISSLIENAAQYSNEGLIEIFVDKGRTSDGRQGVKFSIRDFGIGIPENELRHIFGAFIQSSHTKKISGGKGIGLALCEKIISMHQGEIWAENNVGTAGATFNFIIPFYATGSMRELKRTKKILLANV